MEQLIKIQAELKAPKNQRNNFGNYNYRSAEDILEAVKPLLAKYNCLLTISDMIRNVGDRYYICAEATLTSVETKESVNVTAFAREEETKKGMDGSQITGASSSYARKYALNGLFLIDDTKDADATNTHGKDEPKQEVPTKKRLMLGTPVFDKCREAYLKDKNNLVAIKEKYIVDTEVELQLIKPVK